MTFVQTLDRVSVRPRLTDHERGVLAELAGLPGRVHRIWPGQPGPRSPWVPDEDGGWLLIGPGAVGGEAGALWLRFLIRTVLAPRSATARERAAALGLGVSHRVDGSVYVESSGRSGRGWALSVANNRVTGGLLAAGRSGPERPA